MTFPGGSLARGTHPRNFHEGGLPQELPQEDAPGLDEASTGDRQELTGPLDADQPTMIRRGRCAEAGTSETDAPDVERIDVAETIDDADQRAAADRVAEPADPVDELRSALATAPGEWYVVHSYAGYENKVKANLETRIQTLDVEDYIFQVEVPTEEVTEIKNGQRKQVQRKVLPGYILVRMDLNEPRGALCATHRGSPGSSGPPRGPRR